MRRGWHNVPGHLSFTATGCCSFNLSNLLSCERADFCIDYTARVEVQTSVTLIFFYLLSTVRHKTSGTLPAHRFGNPVYKQLVPCPRALGAPDIFGRPINVYVWWLPSSWCSSIVLFTQAVTQAAWTEASLKIREKKVVVVTSVLKSSDAVRHARHHSVSYKTNAWTRWYCNIHTHALNFMQCGFTPLNTMPLRHLFTRRQTLHTAVATKACREKSPPSVARSFYPVALSKRYSLSNLLLDLKQLISTKKKETKRNGLHTAVSRWTTSFCRASPSALGVWHPRVLLAVFQLFNFSVGAEVDDGVYALFHIGS